MSVFISLGEHPADQTTSAMYFETAAVVAPVHDSVSLSFLVPNCEQLLLEAWHKLAAHVRVSQTMPGC